MNEAHRLHAECMFSIAYLTINVQLSLRLYLVTNCKQDHNSKRPVAFMSITRSDYANDFLIGA